MKSTPSNVMINLMAFARYDHSPDLPMQFITRGTLNRDENNRYILCYRESQKDEESGTEIHSDIEMTMEKDRVTMVRKGDFSSAMVFNRNQRFEGFYRTPYGEIRMAVHTDHVRCDLREDAGSVHLKYQLSLDGAYASTNELHLEYRAEKEKAQ